MRAALLLVIVIALGGVRGSNFSCDFCAASFELAELFANDTSVSSVVAALDTACAKTFRNGTRPFRDCEELAELAAKALAKLPIIVTSGSGYPPRVVCAILFNVCELPCCVNAVQPEQVYVTFAEQERIGNAMRVTWVTLANTSTTVQWGTRATQLQWSSDGSSVTYTDGGWRGHVHHAFMDNLTSGRSYFYRVGDGSTWSPVHSYRVPSSLYPMRVGCIGDMGVGPAGNGTMLRLSALSSTSTPVSALHRKRLFSSSGDGEPIDWLLHVGDVAYADGNQMIWDEYGRQMSAAFGPRMPYVLLPGNHEIAFDFAAFRHRYPMSFAPGKLGESLYWSLDTGGVHWLGIDSESELDVPEITDSQLQWIQSDLINATQRKRSGKLDWIIVALHRPLYCSSDKTQCGELAAYLRGRLESLFAKSPVDLVIQAHAHNYERTTPLFNGTVMPPRSAPVYVVNGIAGCREGNTGNFNPSDAPPWRVVGVKRQPNTGGDLFGYVIMTINATQLRFQAFSDVGGPTLDDFVLQPRA